MCSLTVHVTSAGTYQWFNKLGSHFLCSSTDENAGTGLPSRGHHCMMKCFLLSQPILSHPWTAFIKFPLPKISVIIDRQQRNINSYMSSAETTVYGSCEKCAELLPV